MLVVANVSLYTCAGVVTEPMNFLYTITRSLFPDSYTNMTQYYRFVNKITGGSEMVIG